MKIKIKNRTTLANWGIEFIKAEMSFFMPGKALIVLSGLNTRSTLSDFSFTPPTEISMILSKWFY
jgi:hypothetical protein